MNKLVVATLTFATLVCSIAIARAESPAWNDVLRTCSAEYKERADKTKGSDIWQAFLAECKARKGFVPKRDANKPAFNRIPDKAS